MCLVLAGALQPCPAATASMAVAKGMYGFANMRRREWCVDGCTLHLLSLAGMSVASCCMFQRFIKHSLPASHLSHTHTLCCCTAEALQAADQLQMCREAIRGVAHQAGMEVSFAPKPFPDQAGNGCHCHWSLWHDSEVGAGRGLVKGGGGGTSQCRCKGLPNVA